MAVPDGSKSSRRPLGVRCIQGAVAGLLVLALAWLIWRGEFRSWVSAGLEVLRAAGPVVFFAGMALLPAVGFPMLPFAVAAGPAFGATLGLTVVSACAVAAVAVNVAASYWLAKGAVRPYVVQWAQRLGYRWPELPPGTAWHAVLLVRLIPGPPFWLQSYVLGLAGVAFRPYLVVSTAVPSVMIVTTIVGGDALWRGEFRTGAVALGVLGLAACAVHLWRRLRRPAPGS